MRKLTKAERDELIRERIITIAEILRRNYIAHPSVAGGLPFDRRLFSGITVAQIKRLYPKHAVCAPIVEDCGFAVNQRVIDLVGSYETGWVIMREEYSEQFLRCRELGLIRF